MSSKEILKQQTTIVNESLPEEKQIKKSRCKKEEDKQKHCISMYLTDKEYAELLKAKGDVSQSLFCKKIVLAYLRK